VSVVRDDEGRVWKAIFLSIIFY